MEEQIKELNKKLNSIISFLYAKQKYDEAQFTLDHWSEENSRESTLEQIQRLTIAQYWLDHKRDDLVPFAFRDNELDKLTKLEEQIKG